MQLNIQKTLPGSEESNQDCVRRLDLQGPPNDEDSGDEAVTAQNDAPENIRIPESDDEPFSFLKHYQGREWSEVEHLLRLPPESEKEDDDDEDDWSPAPSQISTDSQDDPFAEDIHDLVNVLDNMIRSQSNLSCDATRVVDYLDLDLFKYETVLSEVQNWSWESDDFLSEESFGSSELDSAPP